MCLNGGGSECVMVGGYKVVWYYVLFLGWDEWLCLSGIAEKRVKLTLT